MKIYELILTTIELNDNFYIQINLHLKLVFHSSYHFHTVNIISCTRNTSQLRLHYSHEWIGQLFLGNGGRDCILVLCSHLLKQDNSTEEKKKRIVLFEEQCVSFFRDTHQNTSNKQSITSSQTES